MNILYEESGTLKVGTVVLENESTLHIDGLDGERKKIKRAHVILVFPGERETLLPHAEKMAQGIAIDTLWTMNVDSEFSVSTLAEKYFKHAPSPIEYTAILLSLRAAPIYFYKRGKDCFKAAPRQALEAALAGRAKKAQEQQKIDTWSDELLQGRIPQAIQQRLMKILHCPEKQSLEYRAFQAACLKKSRSPLEMAFELGAIDSFTHYLLAGFLLKYFPENTNEKIVPSPLSLNNLPLSDAIAFSIDDANTTEIDDAFSVTRLDHNTHRIGIHIAVPTIGIPIGSTLEDMIFQRLSTVYMPDNKITLLPTEVIDQFTLQENRVCPTLSLYIDVTSDNKIYRHETRLEKIKVSKNFCRQSLEKIFNQALLENPDQQEDFLFKKELMQLWLLAQQQKERGVSHVMPPPDYIVSVTNEKITIDCRERHTPVDELVAGMMILANSTWARTLAKARVPALYRVQQSGKVHTSIFAKSHTGLGVNQYAWCTSPLRRAIDFVNQRQLIALMNTTPHFYDKQTLLNLSHNFNKTYRAYLAFQDQLQQAWALRWLLQEKSREITAYYIKKDNLQLKGLPLRVHVPHLPPSLLQGEAVKLAITHIDECHQSIALEFLTTDLSNTTKCKNQVA